MLKSKNLILCTHVVCHKSNSIITIKKHVEQDHGILLKKIQKDVNNFPKSSILS